MTLDAPVKKTYRLLQRTRAEPSFGPSSWVLKKCQHGFSLLWAGGAKNIPILYDCLGCRYIGTF